MADQDASPSAPGKRDESFMDSAQLELYKQLSDYTGEGPAATYRDACRLMASDPPFENESHMLAHLLRELESAIRRICLAPIPQLPKKPKKSKGQNEKKDTHRREIQHILREYGLKENEPVGTFWLSLTEGDRRLSSRVHRQAIGRPRPLDAGMQAMWREFQDFLRIIVRKLEHRYGLFVDQIIAMFQRDVPTAADLDLITNAIPNSPVLLEHFFKHLPHAGWLLPLKDEGFFRDPPEPGPDGKSRYWPQSGYLARMAKIASAQDHVAAILVEIADTRNVAVIRGIIDASVEMPAAKAVALVPYVERWMQAPGAVMVHFKLDDFLLHLAKGGFGQEALTVARLVLKIAPAAEAEQTLLREPRSIIDEHVHEAIVENVMPAVVQVAGFPAFELLCETLVAALPQTVIQYESIEPYTDHSKIWRHTIPGAERHHTHELCNHLISAVRDAALVLAGKDPARLPDIVRALEGWKWTALRRIALFLLSQSLKPPRDLVAERLTDPGLQDDTDLRREYNLLAEAHAGLLTRPELERILQSIEKGPDVLRRKEAHRNFWGEDLTDEQVQQYFDYWQLERLFPFRHILKGTAWGEKCDALVKRYNEPKDEPAYSGFASRVGETSPLSAEQLQAMQLDELIENLRTWQPTGEWNAPTPRGLGHALAALVAKDPVRFAGNALRFQNLEATYVRSVLDGFQQAIKEDCPFPWEKILQLCSWILEQPAVIPGRDPNSFDIDPSWNWTRMQMARLLREALRDGPCCIPFALREQAWQVIASLSEDPEPNPEYEKKYGGDNMDPHHLAINTVRGTALELVILYALWVFRNKKIEIDDELRANGSFAEMPEVHEVLDKHLDPVRDPSLAVRSMYGLYYPQLHLLDRPWARRVAERVFPGTDAERDLHDAAWHTYLLNPAYDAVFEGLRKQYEHAIDLFGSPSSVRSRQLRDPDEHLAGHLIALYISGNIGIGDPLLARFFEKASDELRGTAVGYVGQMLKNDKTTKPDVLDRAIRFWEYRLKEAQNAQKTGRIAGEMMSFAWWFTSGKFDERWELEQLKAALAVWQDVEVDHMAVEQLAKLTEKFPLLCIECLQLIADGKNSAGWGIRGYLEEAQDILRKALASTDSVAREKAEALRNSFIARGYVDEFRDL